MKEQKKTAKKTIRLLKSVPETEQAKVNDGTGESNTRKKVPGIWINNHNETLLVNEAIA
ncbi:MAG: hypothetical protein ACFB2W_25080 [Leptolyngbyaceae cyanobacterium]